MFGDALYNSIKLRIVIVEHPYSCVPPIQHLLFISFCHVISPMTDQDLLLSCSLCSRDLNY